MNSNYLIYISPFVENMEDTVHLYISGILKHCA